MYATSLNTFHFMKRLRPIGTNECSTIRACMFVDLKVVQEKWDAWIQTTSKKKKSWKNGFIKNVIFDFVMFYIPNTAH